MSEFSKDEILKILTKAVDVIKNYTIFSSEQERLVKEIKDSVDINERVDIIVKEKMEDLCEDCSSYTDGHAEGFEGGLAEGKDLGYEEKEKEIEEGEKLKGRNEE